MPYPEDYPYLKLEIGTLSVTLNQFTDYSRKLLHGAKIEYAFSGNAFLKRTPHEPKYLWNLTALANWETRKEFWTVVNAADRAVFNPPFTNYKLTLSDVFLSIAEPVISRPKADLFQAIGTRLSEVEYFAKFLVGLDVSTIEEQPLGDWVQLSFTLNELEKLTI